MQAKRMAYLLGLLLLGAMVVPLHGAEVLYRVGLNTTPLAGHAAGPFALNFQLNDGLGSGDANNTAVLSAFQFGPGGGPLGSPTLVNGATGSLASSITLTDSAFINSFTQGFTPGSQLSFLLRLTTNVDSGPTPDQFSFAILDRTGVELPTTNAFFDAFLTIDINSPNPTPAVFGSNTSRIPNGGGSVINTGVVQVQAIPEPASAGLLGAGLVLLLVRGGLRKRV